MPHLPAAPPAPVKVRAPATSANLGPGFDCLGLALDLWNYAEFRLAGPVAGREPSVDIEGYGAETLPHDAQNLILRAARALYHKAGAPPPGGIQLRCRNAFPPGSGLGSSSAAILLGLLGANALLGHPLSSASLLALAVELEGHPDNVTPALLGGLAISTVNDGAVIARKVPVAPLFLAVVVPDFPLSTPAARAALPPQVPLPDAVYNLGRAVLVVEALRTGDFDLLATAIHDRLHQPYRLPLIPGAADAFAAARRAGAPAVALSGAGPGVIAFAGSQVRARRAAAAMGAAFRAAGLEVWERVTRVAEEGARVGEFKF